ncbi:uncharacterized protein H6S33_009141 [Morchella sextelata]|uniref:uncharacterized protein n=1 Tax=Morchella sextelata TaxID=1174677 RepID=UPI001D0470E5|nr:uncharacterized protein H6S33_009141 [Morchella sextelata]KAH0612761.1 hypothetical protein H6S33_009141 [Morchella sextelata]
MGLIASAGLGITGARNVLGYNNTRLMIGLKHEKYYLVESQSKISDDNRNRHAYVHTYIMNYHSLMRSATCEDDVVHTRVTI